MFKTIKKIEGFATSVGYSLLHELLNEKKWQKQCVQANASNVGNAKTKRNKRICLNGIRNCRNIELCRWNRAMRRLSPFNCTDCLMSTNQQMKQNKTKKKHVSSWFHALSLRSLNTCYYECISSGSAGENMQKLATHYERTTLCYCKHKTQNSRCHIEFSPKV